MIIRSVRAKRFRSIHDERIDCDALTVLVGPNGAGKSTFLRAIELFEAESPRLSPEDYHGGDSSSAIEVSITFGGLDAAALERFKPYVRGGELTVTRVLSLVGGKTNHAYYGERPQHPAFAEIRGADKADEKKRLYSELRKKAGWAGLGEAKTKDAITTALDGYEQGYPEQCVLQPDDGKFFGFTQVAQGYLGRCVRFVSIPAVKDAAEAATEGKGSPISQLLEMVVRSALQGNLQLAALREEVRTRYSEILDPASLPELKTLEKQLSAQLRMLAPNSALALPWRTAAFDLPPPMADVRLAEDGYEASVERCGHGLQRALVLALLQQLALTREAWPVAGTAQEGDAPVAPEERLDLVLLVEEPEIFQHPSRQRHLAGVLERLTRGAVVGLPRIQVVYVTHSPLFVGLDRFDSLRLVRKEPATAGGPRRTRVTHVPLDHVSAILQEALGLQAGKLAGENLRARLQAIMTPWMNEGFFADVVVLVEGEDDRAAILGYASAEGIDLDSEGIAVIPCGGKRNLDRPYVIFHQLGIPAYVLFDGDQESKDPKPEDNRYLLRLLGQPEQDWPDTVAPTFACFRVELEDTLQQELGEANLGRLTEEIKAEFGISKNEDARKRPAVFRRLVEKAKSESLEIPSLKRIVDSIRALRQTT